MARRTKEDAQATRQRLLDAALQVFDEKGVAGASLADIAQAASLTRGAIYWHFKDKADLFDAMLRRATQPLDDAWRQACCEDIEPAQALQGIVNFFALVVHTVHEEPAVRKAFDIALYKVECVGELVDIRQRRLLGFKDFTAHMERQLLMAAQYANVQLPIAASSACVALYAMLQGMLHTWLLFSENGFDVRREGVNTVVLYLKGLGLNACERNSLNIPKSLETAG